MPTNPILKTVSHKLEVAAKTAYWLGAGISEASQTQDAAFFASLGPWLIAELEALQTSLSCLSLDLALRAYLTPPPNAPSEVNGSRSTFWTTATDLVRQVPDSMLQGLEQSSGRRSVPSDTMNIAHTRTSAPASVEAFAGSSQNNIEEASAVEFAEWMLDEVLQGFKRLKSRAPRTGTLSNTSISAPIRTAGSLQTISLGSTLHLATRIHDNMLQDLRRLSDRRILLTDTVRNVETYPTSSARPVADHVLENLNVPSHRREMQYDMPAVRPGVVALDEQELGPQCNAPDREVGHQIDEQDLFERWTTITDVHEAHHLPVNSPQAPIHEHGHSDSVQALLSAPSATVLADTPVGMLKSSDEVEIVMGG